MIPGYDFVFLNNFTTSSNIISFRYKNDYSGLQWSAPCPCNKEYRNLIFGDQVVFIKIL